MTGLFLVHAVMNADTSPDLSGATVIQDAAMLLVTEDDLTALVSILPSGASETLFADPESAAGIAVQHHALLTRLAASHDLAPVRLGAIYADGDAVKAMLRESSGDFRSALRRIAGASEFAMKLTPSSEVATSEDIESAMTGRSYLQRKADQAAAQRSRAERARRVASDTFEAVASFALDHAFASPRRNAQADQEKRLLDAALLVQRSKTPQFEAAVLAAQEIAGKAGYRLTVAGPLPPYSFVDIAGDREIAA
jgi:hypothetical protein